MKNYLNKINAKFFVRSILKKETIHFNYLNLNSYNGRNISYTFINKKTKQKCLIKVYLKQNNNNLKKEIDFIEELKKNDLINFSILSTDRRSYFIRDYPSGTDLLSIIKNNNDNEYIVKSLIKYINSILNITKNFNVVHHLDFRLQNFILFNNNINFVDTDVNHQNHTFFYESIQGEENYTKYKIHTFAKFLVKSLEDLNFEKSITFFNLCKKYIENMTSVKEIILLRFFQSYESNSLNYFVYKNYEIFKDINSSFHDKVTIQQKLKESFSSINNLDYVIARRYKWLDDDKKFKSKDIDIICKKKDRLLIIKNFRNNGWDIYKNKISQYFDRYKTIIKIDLNTEMENFNSIQFHEIISQAKSENGLKIIDELNYFKIIINNSFIKKYLKKDYFEEIENFFQKNQSLEINNYSFLLKSKKYNFRNFYYFSLLDLYKRKFKDFIKNKKIIFIGADGAGKSSNVDLIHNYLKNFVNVEKKYYGNFFFPSGRTNLLLLKTSLVFHLLIFFKKKLKLKKNNNNVSKIQNIEDKKLLFLKSNTYQLFSIFLIPIFLIDTYLHKIITRFTTSRFTVCDRYYEDILLNFSFKKLRKILSFFIYSKSCKILLYASNQLHYNRKKQESIEMIDYMNNVYNENKYDLKINTDIPQNIVSKKILNFVINRVI